MLRDALLVAGKDLRIELRSRVALWQVLPFAVLSLVLFAFALGPGTRVLRAAAPGLFWLAVLFSTVLATQRSFAIESGEGTRDGLRALGHRPRRGLPRQGGGRRPQQLAVLQLVLFGRRSSLFFDVRLQHALAGRRRLAAGHRRAWPSPASSTAPCRPGYGCARRCCRCSSSRSSPRCCWPGRGRGRPPLSGPVVTGLVVAADPRAPSPRSTSSWASSSTGRSRRPGERPFPPPSPPTLGAAGRARRPRGDGGHGLARPVGDPAGPGAGQPRPPASTCTRRSPGWPSTCAVRAGRPRASSTCGGAPGRCSGTAWLPPRWRSGVVFNALTLVTGVDLGPAHAGACGGPGTPG